MNVIARPSTPPDLWRDVIPSIHSDHAQRRAQDAAGRSVLTQVMDSTEMPLVGVWTPDDEAITMLHQWIETLGD